MNLDMLKDTDCSVLILSTPRTGSTALCAMLSNKFNLIDYNEIFHIDAKNLDSFWNTFKNNTRVIFKIFPDQHTQFTEKEFQLLVDKSFVIFLERRDIANQVISYHIASRTNKPWFKKNEIINNYIVDEENIAVSVSNILKLRKEAEKYRKLADISLYYEDIVNDIVNKQIQEYPKPDNYDSLKTKIDNMLLKFLMLKQKYERNEPTVVK